MFLSINLHTTATTNSLCYCYRAALDCDGVVRSGSLLAVGARRVLRIRGVCIWRSGVTVVNFISPKVKDTGILTMISPQERKRQEVSIRLITSD